MATNLKDTGDRRQTPRIKTNLVVQWVGGSGIVRNISSAGMQFETEDSLPADGKRIKITLVIPDHEGEQTYYALCDSEINWTAASAIQDELLNVGASFTELKFIRLPLAA